MTDGLGPSSWPGVFRFDAYDFDVPTATLRLNYSYDNGDRFIETITFPPVRQELNTETRAALGHTFRLLFLLAGVSYYKAYLPSRLECPAFDLDPFTAGFVTEVYRHGLGEFAYRNQLDLNGHIQFAVKPVAPPKPQSLPLPRHLCVPVGGGKDSIVALEALKQSGEPITLFALGNATGIAAPIQQTIAVSGLPAITVARTLSPRLMELNKAGAYNGHVPITAILSTIALAVAIMQGFDAVVMANEHSASAPNLKIGETEINHQYSKSLAFERDFAAYVTKHISPSLHYFSLLRPLSEIAITGRFAKYEKYFSVFRSCNAAFRQDDSKRNKNWCCNCPKCRFVFLALAPFVAKEKLIGIFGKNMLNDHVQTAGFAELCGLSSFKPFECVGEIEESALLLRHLAQQPDWKDDAVIAALAPRLTDDAKNTDKAYGELFKLHPDHRVPAPYLALLTDQASGTL